MSLKANRSLKAEWMEIPEEFFEPLTFGELKVGQEFIDMPWPGDHEGHGGLQQAHYLFTKTKRRVRATNGFRFSIPHGQAVRNSTKMVSEFPCSMPVILVE